MGENDWLFPDAGPSAPLIPIRTTSRDGQTLSKRAQAVSRSELARITKMHALHGKGPEAATCGGCRHLVKHQGYRRGWLKCRRYRMSSSEATDWRARWPACGAFEVREEKKSDVG